MEIQTLKQDRFNVLVQGIREQFPDSFSTAEWDPTTRTDGWIAFVGVAPRKALQMVAQAGVRVKVRTDAGATERDTVAAQDGAYFALIESGVVEDAIATNDPLTGSVEIAYAPAGTAQVQTQPLAESSIRSVDAEHGVSITYQPDTTVDGGSEAVIGGGHLSTCTAGFPVSYNGTTKGVATAKHCGADQKYEGRNVLTFQQASPTNHDVLWYRSSETVEPKFRASSTSVRTIASAKQPTIGSRVCHYGKTTGYSCANLMERNLCANTYCGLVAVDAYISSGGDSGGPWFFNYDAMGIHHGWASKGGKQYSLFTDIIFLKADMGVAVMTG